MSHLRHFSQLLKRLLGGFQKTFRCVWILLQQVSKMVDEIAPDARCSDNQERFLLRDAASLRPSRRISSHSFAVIGSDLPLSSASRRLASICALALRFCSWRKSSRMNSLAVP